MLRLVVVVAGIVVGSSVAYAGVEQGSIESSRHQGSSAQRPQRLHPEAGRVVIPRARTHAGLVAAIGRARAIGAPVYLQAGVYRHAGRLDLSGVEVYGDGASTVLSARSDSSSAVLVGTGTYLHDVTLTSPRAVRRTRAFSGALVIVRGGHGWRIEDCIFERAASNAIVVEGGGNGEIRGNIVRDTLSDGVHVTAGASDILIEGNEIVNTGDDMIGLVSYEKAPPYDKRNRRITVRGNRLLGQSWGRGIGVVGGEDIVIESNLVRHTAGAAVYVACERQHSTFGVDRVRIVDNVLEDVDYRMIHRANVAVYCSRIGYRVNDVTGTGNIFDPGRVRVRISGIPGAVSGVRVD